MAFNQLAPEGKGNMDALPGLDATTRRERKTLPVTSACKIAHFGRLPGGIVAWLSDLDGIPRVRLWAGTPCAF